MLYYQTMIWSLGIEEKIDERKPSIQWLEICSRPNAIVNLKTSFAKFMIGRLLNLYFWHYQVDITVDTNVEMPELKVLIVLQSRKC